MQDRKISVLRTGQPICANRLPDSLLWHGDVEKFLDNLPLEPIFDLAFTSPPYNIGKEYVKELQLVL